MNLQEFLEDTSTTDAWVVAGPGLKFNMRKDQHSIDNELLDCVDIANVSVDPNVGKVGLLFTAKQWLSELKNLAQKHDLVIYIENVLNKQLLMFLKTEGFKKTEDSHDECPSLFFKKG